MTGDTLYTHQLSRAADECDPWLHRWHPELDSPEFRFEFGKLLLMLETDTGRDSRNHLITGWLSGIVSRRLVAEEYEIGRIPRDDHEVKEPYDELVEIRGTDEGIVII